MDTTGDGLITFRDLNATENAAFVADANQTGYIDGDDLLRLPSWADGLDDDGNGFVDDLVGWNFAFGNNNPADAYGQGTLVAGVIGAAGNNAVGVTGVNWDVQLLPLAIGNTSPSAVPAVAAMNYAAALRATYGVNLRAVNSSYSLSFSQSLFDAARGLSEADVLLVAAAGNSGSNNDTTPVYPANFELPNVISVSGTDSYDNWTGSNWGRVTVDLFAPGNSVYTTRAFNVTGGGPPDYMMATGTSVAAAQVTGTAALAAALVPSATAGQVRHAILAGVDPLTTPGTTTVTGGRLNAFNTLQRLTQPLQLRGTEWVDRNGNGARDAGEAGLGNVTVYADLNDNGIWDVVAGIPEPSAVTDAAGTYSVTVASAGSYVVREVVPANYRQTFPTLAAGQRLFAVPADNTDDIVELNPNTGAVLRGSGARGHQRDHRRTRLRWRELVVHQCPGRSDALPVESGHGGGARCRRDPGRFRAL